MKRALLVLMMVFSGALVFAQSSVYFEAGYLPSVAVCNYEKANSCDYFASDSIFYVDLGGKVYLLPFLFVGGNTKCYVLKMTSVEFFPVFASYDVKVGLALGEKVEIGYEHQCSHPVYPMGYLSFMNEPIVAKDEVFNKIYVRATLKF